LRENEQLAHRDHLRGDHNLIARLGNLSGARSPDVGDRFADRRQRRHHLLQRVRVSSYHDGKRALLRANIAAADRRVQALHAHLRHTTVNLTAGGRFDGGMVHKNQAGMRAGDNAVFTQGHGQHIRRVGQIGKDNIRPFCHFPRAFRGARAKSRQLFHLLARAVVHHQWKTSIQQIQRHWFSHQSQADISQTQPVHTCLLAGHYTLPVKQQPRSPDYLHAAAPYYPVSYISFYLREFPLLFLRCFQGSSGCNRPREQRRAANNRQAAGIAQAREVCQFQINIYAQ